MYKNVIEMNARVSIDGDSSFSFSLDNFKLQFIIIKY